MLVIRISLTELASYRQLLNYLDEKQLRATFFAVGSRVLERPNVLIEEYMKGHEIAIHTWAHPVRHLLSCN